MLTVYIEGKPVFTEFATGASVFFLSSLTWTRLFLGREIRRPDTVPNTFSWTYLD